MASLWNQFVNLVAPEPTPQELLFQSVAAGKLDALESWLANGSDVARMYVFFCFSPPRVRAHARLRKRCAGRVDAAPHGGAHSRFVVSDLFGCHAKAQKGHMNVVSRLIELGADVRARTEMGNTPLHIAAMEGHSQVVDYLMQAGASPGAKNARGQNAFDVAQGLVLRQTLMTAVLREENASGSAPVIAGVTRDASKDAERLRNLPPPPISGRAVPPPPSSSSSQAQPLPTQPFIRPDGFVTTVGNPELAAKYGNLTQEPMSAAERAPAPPQAWGVPTMDPASRSRPFARFARVFQRARARARASTDVPTKRYPGCVCTAVCVPRSRSRADVT